MEPLNSRKNINKRRDRKKVRKTNEYKQKYVKIITVLFLVFIMGIFILNIIKKDKDFSELENRMLEQKPKFSFEKLIKGNYTSDYEKYISDQFILRDFWVGVKSRSEKLLGKKENNNVYLGKDGYMLEKFEKPEEKDIEDKIKSINCFWKENSSLNNYVMIVPNSLEILKNKLPKNAPVYDERIYIDKVKNSLNEKGKFIDVENTLKSKSNEYIFYKTDHHWTTKGAYYAYKDFIKNTGFKPKEENDFKIQQVSSEFYGTLYSKSGFRNISPDSINLYIPKEKESYNVWYSDENKNYKSMYSMENLKKKDKYTVFFNSNHPLVKIKTNVENDKKILIIKDSYANCFVPFLTSHYNEIYVVDLRYFDENLSDLIGKNKITDSLILYNANSFFKDNTIQLLEQ